MHTRIKALSPDEYARSTCRGAGNLQCRMLSMGKANFSEARASIEARLSVLGALESPNPTMAAIAEVIGHPLQLAQVNISKGGHTLDEIEPATQAKLRQHLAEDYRLFDWVMNQADGVWRRPER